MGETLAFIDCLDIVRHFIATDPRTFTTRAARAATATGAGPTPPAVHPDALAVADARGGADPADDGGAPAGELLQAAEVEVAGRGAPTGTDPTLGLGEGAETVEGGVHVGGPLFAVGEPSEARAELGSFGVHRPEAVRRPRFRR